MLPYWKLGFCRYNQVKTRPYRIRLGPNPETGTLVRRGKFGYRHVDKHRGEHHVKAEAETEVMNLQAKQCQGLPVSQQKLGEWQPH